MATATLTPGSAVDAFVSEQAKFEAAAGGAAWVGALRAGALRQLRAIGFPHLRQEAWRFTDVRPILRTPWTLAEPASPGAEAKRLLDEITFAGTLESCVLVFVNGHFAPALSRTQPLPKGLRVQSLRAAAGAGDTALQAHLTRVAVSQEHPFLLLNTAFLFDGAFVEIARGAAIESPIHVVHLSTGGDPPAVSHPRTLVVAGESAQAHVIETFASAAPGAIHLTNAVTEIALGAGANVDYLKLQRESAAAFHLSNLWIHQERDSNFFSNNITIGAALTRNDVAARIDGEGIHCALDGLNLLSGRQHVDSHTLLDHLKPHCTSHQLYKSILDGASTNIFNGRIVVHQDAQKTDAIQSNRNMLLSDDATAHSQPNLEIFADDVKCTHGAVVGNVDDEAIFYLQSRGISRAEARGLLTYAFANEIINEIKIEPVRVQLEKIIYERYHLGRP